ncbi:LOW QUALITY PROTEIN: hypothetical protein QYF61_012524 [Mycteria americana]|uniref:Uncharacterized protein n=1 Tax=Mycteria americana TaxID=33587 RepID=A0AAN7PCY7_MYCAM|nr:LOW QUALITY PROTEIN: hypothetical protein QYF61_012524 [Mycteria americana]
MTLFARVGWLVIAHSSRSSISLPLSHPGTVTLGQAPSSPVPPQLSQARAVLCGGSSEVGSFSENASFWSVRAYALQKLKSEAHLRTRQCPLVTDAVPRLDVLPLAVTSAVRPCMDRHLLAEKMRLCALRSWNCWLASCFYLGFVVTERASLRCISHLLSQKHFGFSLIEIGGKSPTFFSADEANPESIKKCTAKQPQFPQPLLTRLVLQTLHQLRCPSLDTLQHLNVSLVVRGPKLNTVFEIRQHDWKDIIWQNLKCGQLNRVACEYSRLRKWERRDTKVRFVRNATFKPFKFYATTASTSSKKEPLRWTLWIGEDHGDTVEEGACWSIALGFILLYSMEKETDTLSKGACISSVKHREVTLEGQGQKVQWLRYGNKRQERSDTYEVSLHTPSTTFPQDTVKMMLYTIPYSSTAYYSQFWLSLSTLWAFAGTYLQPVPMLDKPFSEVKFPNIQSKPPLVQLKAISSCPIICYLGEETDPHLSTPSFQLRCPSLDTLQHLNVSLQVRGPKLNTVIKVRSHQCRVQGHDHFPTPAGHTISDTSQDAIGLLGHLGTLPAHIQPAIGQHPQVLFHQAAFQPPFPKPVALHGIVVTQVQDPALSLVEPHAIGLGSLIQPAQIPLLPTLKQINTPTQLGVICKLTEGALRPLIQIIDKDIKQNQPQY